MLSGGSLPSGLLLGATAPCPDADGRGLVDVQRSGDVSQRLQRQRVVYIAVGRPRSPPRPRRSISASSRFLDQADAPMTLTNNTAGPIALTTPFTITARTRPVLGWSPATADLAGGASTTVA